MKRKWITWIALLSLMVGLLPSGNVEGTTGKLETITQCTTPDQLQKIAEKLMALEVEADVLPQWKDGYAGTPVAYHNLQGHIEAYELPVIVNGKEQGYVVIQASSCQVVEFSEFPSPYHTNAATVEQIAKAWELEVTPTPLYLSPFDKFFVLESDVADSYRVLFNMETYGLLILNSHQRPVSALPDGKPFVLPDFVPTTCNAPYSTSISYSKPFVTLAAKQLSVPVYYQFCHNGCYVGCTPTAGGTLMGYWDSGGFPNLISGGDYQSAIKDLNDRANTWCCGDSTACGNPGSGCTWFTDLTPAMEGFASAKGYTNFDSTYYSGGNATYTLFQSEIDNDRPLVVNFSGTGTDYLHGHSNTGIGYDTAGGNYMILQTNLSSVGTKNVLYGSSYGTLSFNTLIPPVLDTTPPIITFNTPAANHWYNTDRTLSWSITDDNSGVDYYKWAWDDSTPDTQVTGASGSTTFGAVGQGQHTLYVQAWDKAGNASTVASAGWFGYDTTVPTVTFLINNGAITTEQTTVALNLTYGDTGSGVSATRVSNNGLTWGDWTPIAASLPWAIPALDLTTLPVYVQVHDGAGNLSAVVSDTIALDLYPPAPHSANYRMCSTVINTGGSAGITSTGYSLVSSIGQAWNSDASGYASTAFTAGAGFLADVDGCRDITRPAPRGFDIPQWVVASGGNTRSSAGYRLGDTAGEALVSGAQPMQSAGYQLSGGFWGQIVPLACPVPLTGVRITGPTTGTANAALIFTVILTPTNATAPLTITWTPMPQSGQGTTTATYQWATAGSKTITVTVQNCGGTVTATQTIVLSTPPPTCPVPLVGVGIRGPLNLTETVYIDTGYLFTAILTPANATPPITYTWTLAPQSGQGTATATYQWATAGSKTINLSVQNCGGTRTTQRTLTVVVPAPAHTIYLPLVLRSKP